MPLVPAPNAVSFKMSMGRKGQKSTHIGHTVTAMATYIQLYTIVTFLCLKHKMRSSRADNALTFTG